MNHLYRQGDILLRRVERIPAGAKATSHTRLVIAEGEATGHHHLLTADVEEHLTADERFLRIMGANGLLTHEEHATITLPPGDYQVVRQVEYEPESVRYVAD